MFITITFRLLRFFVERVLAAEPAILLHFQSVRVILLVLFRVVVALLALGAYERNLNSCFIGHFVRHLPFQNIRLCRETHTNPRVPPSI